MLSDANPWPRLAPQRAGDVAGVQRLPDVGGDGGDEAGLQHGHLSAR